MIEKTTPVLQVDHLHFSYPQRPLFTDWSARIGSGVTLVLGGDGSGKTTLLRLLAAACRPDQGHLVLAGTALADAPQAYQQQLFWQDPRSDALDALSAHAWFDTLPERYRAWSAPALAAHVEGFALTAHLEKPLYQLSAGSKRKVLMAAALACGAALTLIDEPVAGLDRPSVLYLQRALTEASTQPGRATVVAHYERLDGVPWSDVIELPD
ncbi:MAG: ATP-binding cassette domain-containing protein [Burkholderiaceae bacterium]|nr:ATP-binding cassette domain-containing protein [Burkholderiaceae bacterium]